LRAAPGSNRVLCYGVTGGGVHIPGSLQITPRGTLPEKCWVKVMGSSVGLTNWGVFKHKNNPGLPSQNGWWSPGNITPTNSELPLYLFGLSGQELCRTKSGSFHFPGQLVRVSGSYRCRAPTLNGFTAGSSFELFMAHRTTGVPKWSGWTTGNDLQYGLALRISDGPAPWQRVYQCKQYPAKRIGYLRESEGKCKVPGSTAATAEAKFMLLRK